MGDRGGERAGATQGRGGQGVQREGGGVGGGDCALAESLTAKTRSSGGKRPARLLALQPPAPRGSPHRGETTPRCCCCCCHSLPLLPLPLLPLLLLPLLLGRPWWPPAPSCPCCCCCYRCCRCRSWAPPLRGSSVGRGWTGWGGGACMAQASSRRVSSPQARALSQPAQRPSTHPLLTPTAVGVVDSPKRLHLHARKVQQRRARPWQAGRQGARGGKGGAMCVGKPALGRAPPPHPAPRQPPPHVHAHTPSPSHAASACAGDSANHA